MSERLETAGAGVMPPPQDADFLSLPGRPPKPRQAGITHVIDKGLPLRDVEAMLDSVADYIDIVKLGWGTPYVTRHLPEKIRIYERAATPAVPAGTLLAVSFVHPPLAEWRRVVAAVGRRQVALYR